MSSSLVLTALDGIPTISKGDDLAEIISSALKMQGIQPASGDIFVLAQKIVSKAEGRSVKLSSVTPSAKAKEIAAEVLKDPRVVELILSESKSVLRAIANVLVVEHRLGFILANAGIDASNVEGGDDSVLLLPENPDASAALIHDRLKTQLGIELGIVINDSFGRAWRLGTTGTAIGIANVPGLIDLRGQNDRNKRKLLTSELGAADELAAAASLLMGQAGEGRPIIHVRGFPYNLREGKAGELIRPKDMDLFR